VQCSPRPVLSAGGVPIEWLYCVSSKPVDCSGDLGAFVLSQLLGPLPDAMLAVRRTQNPEKRHTSIVRRACVDSAPFSGYCLLVLIDVECCESATVQLLFMSPPCYRPPPQPAMRQHIYMTGSGNGDIYTTSGRSNPLIEKDPTGKLCFSSAAAWTHH
jgi:hypothetical protein